MKKKKIKNTYSFRAQLAWYIHFMYVHIFFSIPLVEQRFFFVPLFRCILIKWKRVVQTMRMGKTTTTTKKEVDTPANFFIYSN